VRDTKAVPSRRLTVRVTEIAPYRRGPVAVPHPTPRRAEPDVVVANGVERDGLADAVPADLHGHQLLTGRRPTPPGAAEPAYPALPGALRPRHDGHVHVDRSAEPSGDRHHGCR